MCDGPSSRVCGGNCGGGDCKCDDQEQHQVSNVEIYRLPLVGLGMMGVNAPGITVVDLGKVTRLLVSANRINIAKMTAG